MSRQRVFWVDACKCICMLCIVNTHLFCTPQALRELYEPFHLSLFFFLAGYCYTHRPGLLRLMGKKARTLLLPWALISTAGLAVSGLTHGGAAGFLPELLDRVKSELLTGEINWFIPALFTTFVPLYVFAALTEAVDRRAGRCAAAPIVGILLTLAMAKAQDTPFFWMYTFPWRLHQCLEYSVYVAWGYLYRRFLEVRLPALRHPAPLCALAAAYVWAAKYAYTLRLGLARSWNVVLIYGTVLLGLALVISLARRLPENRLIAGLGQNTLLIFLLHGKVYSVLEGVLMRVAAGPMAGICENPLLAGLLSLVLTPLVALPLLPVSRWIRALLPWILGDFEKRRA